MTSDHTSDRTPFPRLTSDSDSDKRGVLGRGNFSSIYADQRGPVEYRKWKEPRPTGPRSEVSEVRGSPDRQAL